MNPTALAKLLLMNAACTNALAVCGNAAGPDSVLAVDPLIADTEIRDKGVMVYEAAKIQYHALLRAFQDTTGIWPDPKLPAGSGVNVGVQAGPVGVNVVVDALKKLAPDSPIGTIGALLSALTQGLNAETPKTPNL